MNGLIAKGESGPGDFSKKVLTGLPRHDEAPLPRIVVCVATCRRAVQLAALLRALAKQRLEEPFGVLIGNNAPDDEATFALLRNHALPLLDVLPVAERGVVAVRNAMIAQLLAARTPPEWIACIDDDQEPDDNWLRELVTGAQRHRADVAGGPVTQVAERRTFWSAGATDTSYLPEAEGPVDVLNEAGNLILSAGFLTRLERLPFSPTFGRTGGEDYEFFLFAASRRAKIIWLPDARVIEVIPMARLSLKGLVWRAYSTGASQARADRLYRTRAAVFLSAFTGFAKAPPKFIVSWLRARSFSRSTGIFVRSTATFVGRMAGLFGIQAERYGALVSTSVVRNVTRSERQ